MTIRQICHFALLTVIIALTLSNNAAAQTNNTQLRAIPEDNLAYPVLIILKNGSKGSGFFLNTPAAQYLVTANHVIAEDMTLVDPTTKMYKPDAEIEAISYSRDITDNKRNLLKLNLQILQTSDHIRADILNDVMVMTVGTYPTSPTTTQPQVTTPVPGATWAETATEGTVGASLESVKTLNQVLIGNDVIVFGYPTSLGLQQNPQLDPDRPLLRKGIVAGKNIQRGSLILDCPIYFGNSGGPVFEIDREGFKSGSTLERKDRN